MTEVRQRPREDKRGLGEPLALPVCRDGDLRKRGLFQTREPLLFCGLVFIVGEVLAAVDVVLVCAFGLGFKAVLIVVPTHRETALQQRLENRLQVGCCW